MSRQIKRINPKSTVTKRAVAGTVAGAVLVGGAGTALATQKQVTVDVNGEETNVRTYAADVAGALSSAGVEVAPEDLVYPAPGEKLSSGDTVTVRTAKPVAVVIDGVAQEITSTAGTVGELIDQAGVAGHSAVDVDRDQPVTHGMNLDVTTPKIVALRDGGDLTYVSAAAKTVGDLLAARGVTFDTDDRLNVALTDTIMPGMEIVLDRVSTVDRPETVVVEAPAEYVDDDSLDEGTEEVRQKGEQGETKVIHRTVTVNGQVESEGVAEEKEVKKAKPALIARGTKQAGNTGAARARGGLRQRVGRPRAVRVWRRLVHQHRQRLPRRPAVHPVHLGGLRRHRLRADGQPGYPRAADRHRRANPGLPGLGRLAGLHRPPGYPLDDGGATARASRDPRARRRAGRHPDEEAGAELPARPQHRAPHRRGCGA